MTTTRQPVLTAPEIEAFLAEVFPQLDDTVSVRSVGPMTARLRLEIGDQHLRPGGTVSGPTMFMLADCAFYVAVLGMIGREALAMTSTLTINFLSKPRAEPMTGEARILKLGRLLAVGEVSVLQGDRLVAHATVTYALPQDR